MDITRFVVDGAATPWLSVSIERTSACNLHVGLVYRDARMGLRRLHLAWHRRLDPAPYTPLACAIPLLDEADAKWMTIFFGRIARHAPANRIPYNLKYDEDVAFNPDTGEIIFGPNSTGLGCGTFVLAAFRSSGNPLVDPTGWPDSDYDDIAAQMRFVNLLLASPIPDRQSQGRRVKGEIGTKRIRPDHVAGACLEDALPVRHPECEANAAFIVGIIDGGAPHLAV